MTLTDLYDYYLDKAGHLNRWMRGGTIGPVLTVPDAPNITSVSITSGGTATIAWTPPVDDGGSPVTGYSVTRIGGATHTLGVVSSDTFTGLTAGVTYTFTVAAINTIGTGPSDSASAASSDVSTVWGINNNAGFSWMTVAARKSWFAGRMPVLRVYDNPWVVNQNFGIVSPEGRTAYSWKAGGAFSEVQLGNGTATPTMIHWLQSIPAGEQVWWGFHHEVNNGSIQPNGTYMEVTPANYLATYHQMRLALNAAHLQAGVQVIICCNFMMEVGVTTTSPKWSNAWVPPRTDCDCFTVDLYGNPAPSRGPNKYGGLPDDGTNKTRYDTTYPLVSSRMAGAFGIIQACGYADSWGIWEFNSPQKSWDPDETGRILWHNDYIAEIKHPPMTGNVPAKIALFWEAPIPPASTWDQRYGRLDLNPNRMIPILKPLITGTPVRR